MGAQEEVTVKMAQKGMGSVTGGDEQEAARNREPVVFRPQLQVDDRFGGSS